METGLLCIIGIVLLALVVMIVNSICKSCYIHKIISSKFWRLKLNFPYEDENSVIKKLQEKKLSELRKLYQKLTV